MVVVGDLLIVVDRIDLFGLEARPDDRLRAGLDRDAAVEGVGLVFVICAFSVEPVATEISCLVSDILEDDRVFHRIHRREHDRNLALVREYVRLDAPTEY